MKKRMSIDTLIEQNLGFNTYTYSESTPYAEGIMDQSRDFFNRNSRQAKFISKFIVNKKVDLDKMSSDEALEYLNIMLSNLSTHVKKFIYTQPLHMFLGFILFGWVGLAVTYIRAPKKADVENLILFVKSASKSSNDDLKYEIETTLDSLVDIFEKGIENTTNENDIETIDTALKTIKTIQKHLK